MTYLTQGVVLKHRIYRDHDLFCTFYSPDYGKLDVFVKGARRTKSKLRGGIEVLNKVEIMVAKGVNWFRLAGQQTQQIWPNLRLDYHKTIYALSVIEVIDIITEEGEADQDIYRLLVDWLDFLDTCDFSNNKKIEIILLLVIWRLLKYTGYGPLVTACIRCNKKTDQNDNFFSISEGGLVCQSCKRNGDTQINIDIVKLIRYFFKEDSIKSASERFIKIKLDDDLIIQFDKVLRDFILNILEKYPNTFKFFSK